MSNETRTSEILQTTIEQNMDELASTLKAVKIGDLSQKDQMYVAAEIIGIIRDANLRWATFRDNVPALKALAEEKA